MKSVRLSVFRILAIAFVLLLSLQSLYSNGISEIAEPVPGVSFGAGRREVFGDVKLVDLRGSWYEMGRQYGYLMKEELSDVYAFVEYVIQAKEGNSERADSIGRQQEVQTPYRILEFMRGASETSGLSLEQLNLVNAVERIGGLPMCSVAMAWGEYTDSGMVIGRNYDYSDIFSRLYKDVAVTVYHPADGALATATIGYVGEIYAVNAINEKGLFLELNNGRPSARIKSPNYRITGTTMLFNTMFESDEIEDMELFFNTTNCSSSYIINVADREKGLSFEWCPIGVKHGEASLPEGLIVSTNHYLNPEWEFPVPTDEKCWDGITRRDNLIRLCEEKKGSLDPEAMMKIIETDISDGGAMNDMTVYQYVIVPESFELWVRVNDSPEPRWEEVDLRSYLLR